LKADTRPAAHLTTLFHKNSFIRTQEQFYKNKLRTIPASEEQSLKLSI